MLKCLQTIAAACMLSGCSQSCPNRFPASPNEIAITDAGTLPDGIADATIQAGEDEVIVRYTDSAGRQVVVTLVPPEE